MKKNLQRGMLIVMLFSCVQLHSFAQSSISKKASPAKIVVKTIDNDLKPFVLENPEHSSLGYASCNAKTLYEKVFQVSLSVDEFRSKCRSSQTNKNNWIIVRDYYAGSTDVDLSGVEAMIASFDAKL